MILQTTGGIPVDSFVDELFPLGYWCDAVDNHSIKTALDLPDTGDVDVENESTRLIKILEESLYPRLNSLHKVNFPDSYWRQSVGTFFQMLVPLIIQRYNLIRRARDHAGCDKFLNLQTPELASPLLDRRSLIQAANSHLWNYEIMTALCTALHLKPADTNPMHEIRQDLQIQPSRNSQSLWKKLLATGLNFVATRSKFLIVRTMLPRRLEFLLAMRHFTFPLVWDDDFVQGAKVDLKARSTLVSSLPTLSDYENAILKIATLQIPMLFIEDYAQARKHAHSKLPRRPSVIFTSNLHHGSDVFLLWIAEMRCKGTQIVIAQHGGVHSLCRDVPGDIQSEREQSDRYITWGKPNFESSVAVAGPTLVNVGIKRKVRVTPKTGPVLIILDSSYRYPSVPRGMNGSRFRYSHFLAQLIKHLDPNVVREIALRPYPGAELFDDPIVPLLGVDSRVIVDDLYAPIQEIMSRSRIVIATSLGTTFFQAIHLRIPTILLLDPMLSPISPTVADMFENLKHSSIFFDDPRELADHINNCFMSIDNWWLEESLQNVIAKFEAALSPSTKHPIIFYSNQLKQARHGS